MTELVIVTDCWGEQDARLQTPLVGQAGAELARMLHQAGYPCEKLPFNFSSSYRMMRYWDSFPYPILSVFNKRPPNDDITSFYAKPKDKVPLNRELPSRRIDNSIHFLRDDYTSHLTSLHDTLRRLSPNIIVALGNTALWALGQPPVISKLRGNIVESPYGKLLPTHHPTSVLRKWSQRTISLLDLHKAYRERATPSVKTLPREIWTEPTIPDLYEWWERYGSKSKLLAFDIETIKMTQVSEVGFAADSNHALHIPFFYKDQGRFVNWWPDAKTELEAWDFVKMVCESDVPKIGQNVVQYDLYWMIHSLNIQVRNIQHDTMTLAHAWQPELEKSLGFLGSIFLDELSWKSIRTDTSKQND